VERVQKEKKKADVMTKGGDDGGGVRTEPEKILHHLETKLHEFGKKNRKIKIENDFSGLRAPGEKRSTWERKRTMGTLPKVKDIQTLGSHSTRESKDI